MMREREGGDATMPLPGDVEILEVRHVDGYGARWTADGSFFRGFLEPQMEDGHHKGACCLSLVS